MFLAWKEIRHQPLRFALIAAVIALTSCATFLLSGLASGLAFRYRGAAEQLDVASIVLTQDSNGNVSASRFTDEQMAAAASLPGDQVQPITLTPAVSVNNEERTDVYVFGLDPQSFIAPEVTQGREVLDSSQEVVADESIVASGYGIGDQLTLTDSSRSWRIVGLTSGSTFITLPVVYVDRQALAESASSRLPTAVSALAVKDRLPDADLSLLSRQGLVPLTLEEFITTLPGYTAQVLTFSVMIGVLILLSAMVLSIFLYVLTLQKRPVLGILKARGVPTGHLIWSGASQTVIISAAGVAIGFLLTFFASVVLPDPVPFRLDYLLDLAIMGGFILFSIIGSLMSIRVVSTIDPVEAIA